MHDKPKTFRATTKGIPPYLIAHRIHARDRRPYRWETAREREGTQIFFCTIPYLLPPSSALPLSRSFAPSRSHALALPHHAQEQEGKSKKKAKPGIFGRAQQVKRAHKYTHPHPHIDTHENAHARVGEWNTDANFAPAFALVISELQQKLFTLREALAESRGKTRGAQRQGLRCVHAVLGGHHRMMM
jgi:hypothetical protein